MVSLKLVQQSNAALRSATSSRVSLFVGATSGLALATVIEYARQSTRPKIYIVGRNPSKLSTVIKDLEKVNAQGTYIPIQSEFSLFKNVDTACEELKAREKSLDLLLMCPGYLKIGRVPGLYCPCAHQASLLTWWTADNEDGIEDTISLRYYVRARFIQNLLPLLSSLPSSRIVSIHGAGKEGHLNEDDLELKHTFTMQNAAMHTSTMNTLALEAIAATHPTISCVHVFPGIVITPGFDVFSEDWALPWRVLFRRMVLPLMKLFTTSLPESGQRHLFHATSARYPPAEVKDPPGAGVARPKGVETAKGADWEDGTGCYLLGYNGETIGDKKLMDEYRHRGMGKKIWQHTQEVFDRALVKG